MSKLTYMIDSYVQEKTVTHNIVHHEVFMTVIIYHHGKIYSVMHMQASNNIKCDNILATDYMRVQASITNSNYRQKSLTYNTSK